MATDGNQEKAKVTNKELVAKYFVEGEADIWKCRCGSSRKKGRGWQKFLDHIQRDHDDTIQHTKESEQSSIIRFFRRKDSNLFNWVKWIVEDLLPFNFCEKENPRSFTNLEPISRDSLKDCNVPG